MDALFITGAALGVGVVVYALSLRAQVESLKPEPHGFGREPESLPGPEPESFVHVPVLRATELGWRTRVGGGIGLLLVIMAAALAVVLGVYQLAHVMNQTVQGFLGQ